MSFRSTFGTAWQVLATEGWRSFWDRGLDRLAFRRRQRTFALQAPGALKEGLAPSPLMQPCPPVLNVLPTAPRPDLGGVQGLILRRLKVEKQSRPWALLYPLQGGYRLEMETGGKRTALLLEGPGLPPHPTLAQVAFEHAVGRAMNLVGAPLVHVEQPTGLPPGSLANLAKRGWPLILTLHDFGLFCPRPHLLEAPSGVFCHYSRDKERCRACLAETWPLEASFLASWREQARGLLDQAAAVIYPSEFLRREMAALFGDSGSDRQHVIPPQAPPQPALPGEYSSGRPIRHLALLGGARHHKGGRLFLELVRAMPSTSLRWTVLGGGDKDLLEALRSQPGVQIRGYYRNGTLPNLLRRQAVDLALLLSITPESYGLTLDECWSAGVPVLALDHGAPAERIRELGGGLVVPADISPTGLASALSPILDQGTSSLPSAVESSSARWSASRHRKVYDMLLDCLELHQRTRSPEGSH